MAPVPSAAAPAGAARAAIPASPRTRLRKFHLVDSELSAHHPSPPPKISAARWRKQFRENAETAAPSAAWNVGSAAAVGQHEDRAAAGVLQPDRLEDKLDQMMTDMSQLETRRAEVVKTARQAKLKLKMAVMLGGALGASKVRSPTRPDQVLSLPAEKHQAARSRRGHSDHDSRSNKSEFWASHARAPATGEKREFDALTSSQHSLAKRALLQNKARNVDATDFQALLHWTHHCDAFQGLSAADRKMLCRSAVGRSYKAGTPILQAGDMDSSIHIVFDGQATVCTTTQQVMEAAAQNQTPKQQAGSLMMRPQNGGGHERNGAISLAGAVKLGRLQGTQQPKAKGSNLLQISEGAVLDAPLSSAEKRKQSVDQSAAKKGPMRRASVVTATMTEDRGGGGGGMPSIVTVWYEEGDAFGAERAFHNVTPAEVEAFGVRYVSSTVVSDEETDTVVMEFSEPAQILLFEQAYHRNRVAKSGFFRSLQAYKEVSRESLDNMATTARRVWHPAGHTLAQEGSEARNVYFLVHGQVTVMQGTGRTEKLVGVHGRGFTVGEREVVNKLMRPTTVITASNCELLAVNAPNFVTIADPQLLKSFAENTEADEPALAPSVVGRPVIRASLNPSRSPPAVRAPAAPATGVHDGRTSWPKDAAVVQHTKTIVTTVCD